MVRPGKHSSVAEAPVVKAGAESTGARSGQERTEFAREGNPGTAGLRTGSCSVQLVVAGHVGLGSTTGIVQVIRGEDSSAD